MSITYSLLEHESTYGSTGTLKGVSSFNSSKHAGIYSEKESPSDVAICCTVCREGKPISQIMIWKCHVLTSSLSGKTSLIHSIASELGLDIYVVSLSSKGCVFDPSLYYLVNLGE